MIASKDITSLESYDFKGLENLEEIHLSSNQLSSLPEKVFDGLSKLEHLYLQGNQLSSFPFPDKIFSDLKSIWRLDLRYNGITALPDEVLQHLPNPEALRLFDDDKLSHSSESQIHQPERGFMSCEEMHDFIGTLTNKHINMKHNTPQPRDINTLRGNIKNYVQSKVMYYTFQNYGNIYDELQLTLQSKESQSKDAFLKTLNSTKLTSTLLDDLLTHIENEIKALKAALDDPSSYPEITEKLTKNKIFALKYRLEDKNRMNLLIRKEFISEVLFHNLRKFSERENVVKTARKTGFAKAFPLNNIFTQSEIERLTEGFYVYPSKKMIVADNCEKTFKTYMDFSKLFQKRVSYLEEVLHEISEKKTPLLTTDKLEVSEKNKPPKSLQDIKSTYVQKLKLRFSEIVNESQSEDKTSLSRNSLLREEFLKREKKHLQSLKKKYDFSQIAEEEVREKAYVHYLSSLYQSADPQSDFVAMTDLGPQGRTFVEDETGKLGFIFSKTFMGPVVIEAFVAAQTPAETAGLKVGDQITHCRPPFKDATWISLRNMPREKISSYLSGEPNSQIELKILRDHKERTFVITRTPIKLQPSIPLSIFEVKTPTSNEKIKVGVLTLNRFILGMTIVFKETLEKAKAKGVQSLVVDLSQNPGGAYLETSWSAGLFVHSEETSRMSSFFERPFRVPMDTINPTISETTWTGPLTIVISDKSASAAELFAGGLKDIQRALIVGTPSSFGKFTVQSVKGINLSKEASSEETETQQKHHFVSKITTSLFFTPSGKNLLEKGVASHILLPSLKDSGERYQTPVFDRFDAVAFLPHKAWEKLNQWQPVSQNIINKVQDEFNTHKDSKKKQINLLEMGKSYQVLEENSHRSPWIQEAVEMGSYLYQAIQSEK